MRYTTYLHSEGSKEGSGILENYLKDTYDTFPTLNHLNHDLRKEGFEPVTRKQYQYELLINRRGEAILKQYDTIHCKGIRAVVDEVRDCDIHPEYGVSCEFTDIEGNYRSWKSEIDGGTIDYMEEGAIAAAEKVTQRLLYRDIRTYFRNEGLRNTPYTVKEFESDMVTGIVPLAYSTTENGEYEIQVNLDAYDNTVFLEIPEELQGAAGTERYVMEKYKNIFSMGADVARSYFDQYIGDAECILSDLAEQISNQQERE